MDGFVKIAGIHEKLIKEVVRGALTRKKASDLLLESVQIISENIRLILATSQDQQDTLSSLLRYYNTLVNDIHNFKAENAINIRALIKKCIGIKEQIQAFSETKHAAPIRVKLRGTINNLSGEIKSLQIMESQSKKAKGGTF